VLDCTVDHGHTCPQVASVAGIVLGDEDCLYMDIYSPVGADENSKLPVMVWFYGGAYIFGDKYEFGLYDATNLVDAHKYVHVALNYRLSVFGFLALPGLQSEDPNNSTGNYALQDQTAVLQFVQRNIQNFGGDPAKVTIFGESAGAFSVCWHLVSPTSKGLFRAAIMQSGNCENPGFFYPLKDAMTFGRYYADVVGCNSSVLSDKELVACLRKLPTSGVLQSGTGRLDEMSASYAAAWSAASWKPKLFPLMPWGPAIDGAKVGLVDLPWNLITSGNFNKVPLIIGTNTNEGNLFVPGIPFITGQWFPLTRYRFTEAMLYFFNATTVERITQMYQYEATTWEQVVALIIRDWFFGCSARKYAAAFNKHQVPAYLYHFTHESPNWIDQWLLGTYHSSELEFVFSNPWPPYVHRFDKDDEIMAATFGGYWTNLAYSTDPNKGPASSLLEWPIYIPATSPIMNMRVPTVLNHQYLENVCPFWDAVTQLI